MFGVERPGGDQRLVHCRLQRGEVSRVNPGEMGLDRALEVHGVDAEDPVQLVAPRTASAATSHIHRPAWA